MRENRVIVWCDSVAIWTVTERDLIWQIREVSSRVVLMKGRRNLRRTVGVELAINEAWNFFGFLFGRLNVRGPWEVRPKFFYAHVIRKALLTEHEYNKRRRGCYGLFFFSESTAATSLRLYHSLAYMEYCNPANFQRTGLRWAVERCMHAWVWLSY